MRMRTIGILGIVASAGLVSSCRKAPKEEPVAVVEPAVEAEPNDRAANVNEVPLETGLTGTVSAGDVDVVRAAQGNALRITGPATIRIFALHTDGRRVELAMANEAGVNVSVPDRGWSVELSGDGAWRADVALDVVPSDCGFALGDASAPLNLGFASLPAEFPLCVGAGTQAALVRVPLIRPAGVAAFETRLDGADPAMTGTLRVMDGQRTYAEVSLASSRALPALRWVDGHELNIVLLAQGTSETPARAMLRIEGVRAPNPGEPLLEIEPNDSAVDALVMTSRLAVAGSLYQLSDVDRFRVEPMVGPVRVEVMAAAGAPIRVQAGSELEPVYAVPTGEGRWEICRLDPVETLSEVRVSFAPEATFSEALVYQMTLREAVGAGNELTPNESIAVPDGIPWGEFGIAAGDAGLLSKIQGRIFPPEDIDQWLLHVPPAGAGGEPSAVTVRVATQSVMDLRVRLLDGDGVPVATADRTGAGQAESIEMELPEGYYVVEVSAAGAQGCDASYEIDAFWAAHGAGGLHPKPDGELRGRALPGQVPEPAPSRGGENRPNDPAGSQDVYPW